MSKTIERINRRLVFTYNLLKKTVRQNFTRSNNGFSYLSKKETKLKDLLGETQVEKANVEAYFGNLSDALYDNFTSSGISYKDFCRILAGKLVYSRSGFTPDKVQQVLVDNYCKTNGLFQEILFDFMSRDHDQKLTIDGPSVFGKVESPLVRKIVEEVSQQGYSKLPFTLPKEKVDTLVNWSKDLTYTIIDDSLAGKYPKSKVDFNNITYAKASAAEEDLKKNELVMQICNDPLLVSILQNVLGTRIDLLHLSMWWSFKIGKPSSEAAQYFHYDLDTLRWLKIFIYLTDVGPSSGPHIAIPGSHNLGGKNYKLLSKGYDRISDEEIKKSQAGEITEFCGPAGTIIIGDTRCWHKGKEILDGNRLILQPTYSHTSFLKRVI